MRGLSVRDFFGTGPAGSERFDGVFGGPAPGYRLAGSGVLYFVGNSGCNWSSTVSTTSFYGIYLNFHSQDTSNSIDRARGFLLRCLSE